MSIRVNLKVVIGRYIDYQNAQLIEFLTNYGKVNGFGFDAGGINKIVHTRTGGGYQKPTVPSIKYSHRRR